VGSPGLFTRRDQVVKGAFVCEDAPRKPVEIVGPAARAAPREKLRQMQQLVLENPLQSLEAVATFESAHGHRAIDVVKRVEKKGSRDRDLILNRHGRIPLPSRPAYLPRGLTGRAHQSPRQPKPNRVRSVFQQHFAKSTPEELPIVRIEETLQV